MPGRLKGNLLQLRARAAPAGQQAVRRVLGAEVSAIVERARGRWPVDTGRSRRELQIEPAPDRGRGILRFRIKATRYSPHIVSRGVRPWRDYIQRPLAALIRDIPGTLARAMVRAAGGRRGG